ncbi:alpha/beta fold hydrolase [Halovulum sp. GXIMD14794]
MPHFTTPDGLSLHYTDEGSGPPVLCLAGLTRNTRDFDSVAAHLRPSYRVIRLDSRGRGGSDWAKEPVAEYTVPAETRDVEALLDHLGLPQVSIIGTSRGGILGMTLAAVRPGSVMALVLNDIGAVIEARGLVHIMSYLGRPPQAATFAEAAQELAGVYGTDFPGVPLTRWEQHARAIYRESEGGLGLSYDPHLRTAVGVDYDMDLPHVELWPLFDAVLETPILCIRGANSNILTAETVAEMKARHPGMVTVEIPDRGHAPFLDEPPAVTAIDAFLKEHAS